MAWKALGICFSSFNIADGKLFFFLYLVNSAGVDCSSIIWNISKFKLLFLLFWDLFTFSRILFMKIMNMLGNRNPGPAKLVSSWVWLSFSETSEFWKNFSMVIWATITMKITKIIPATTGYTLKTIRSWQRYWNNHYLLTTSFLVYPQAFDIGHGPLELWTAGWQGKFGNLKLREISKNPNCIIWTSLKVR